MNRAINALREQIANDVRRRGFENPTEWAVLEFLYHKGPQSLSAVADRILICNASVTYVVDKLEAQGLLERRPCPEDRRIKFAALTPKGEAVLAREFPGHAEFVRRLLSSLTSAQQVELRSLLKQVGFAATAAGAGQN